jgi:glycosyltransferase involved in cell wall biosynthesis
LAGLDETVHLLSADPCPERYAFVRRAILHDGQDRSVLFERPRLHPGVVSHTITQTIYPLTYRREEMQEAQAKSLLEFSAPELDAYVERNSRLLARITMEENLHLLHVNHAVMLPYIARQAQRETGVPFVTTIHGSCLEYIVRRDPRFLRFALEGLRGCSAIIVLNPDGARRVLALDSGLASRLIEIPGGVDTEAFEPVCHAGRAREVRELFALLATDADGCPVPQGDLGTEELLGGDPTPAEVAAWMDRTQRSFDPMHWGPGLTDRLAAIGWDSEPIVAFVGKLMVDKGVHVLLAAAPLILQEFPTARFLIIGGGPFRAGLVLLATALERNRTVPLAALQAAMTVLEPGNVGLDHITGFLNEAAGSCAYPGHLLRGRVVFAGPVSQGLLCRLLPLAHVNVIPSLVPEALPLVFLEALASGVVPVCAEAGGLADMAGRLAARLPELDGYLTVRPEPATMATDFARQVRFLLRRMGHPQAAETVRTRCRAFVEEEYSWHNVARRLQDLYRRTVAVDAPAIRGRGNTGPGPGAG